MMCGRVVFPHWDILLGVVAQVYARQLPTFLIPGPSEDPDSIRDCLISLLQLRQEEGYPAGGGHLLDLLQAFHPFKASDPRDKIYSLFSHSLDHQHLGLAVDYTIPAEDLYTTVAARVLAKCQDLDLLLSNLHGKTLDLASWVPDWSTWHFGCDMAGMGFYATLDAASGTPAVLRADETARTLGVSGCLVSKINWVGERILPYYVTHDGPVIVAQRKLWIERQAETVRKLEQYMYPEETNILAVLWKTLIAGATHDEVAPDDTYVEYFNAHLDATMQRSPLINRQARSFCDAVRWRSRYRCLATTENGYFGAVPQTAQVGDWVCMFHGGRHLFVVRPSGTNFEYVGHAYVHGLMTGQVLTAQWYKNITITLV